jgi:FLVCR family feline leukemia virus subgroup C receptor-related protein
LTEYSAAADAGILGLMIHADIQPINAKLAVNVTYPGDETEVESVQQAVRNLNVH